jgi:hypothetical protein
MRQDGDQIVRTDAFWDNVEPYAPVNGQHRYNWTHLDQIVSALAAQGLHWLPIVDYSAPWAASRHNSLGQPNLYSPPANNADYAAYAQALIQRYATGGAFWSQHPALTALPVTAVEIWNEENGSVFWQPQPNAAAYTAMYEAARDAIHAVDPTVEVLVGGLANPGAPFLQGMYSALNGASGRIDGVALHPYFATPSGMYSDVVDVRSVLEQHGDASVPIDLTEYGWTTRGSMFQSFPTATDQQRAQYLQQFTQALAQSNCGIERLTPYTWVSPEKNAFNPEDWFGIVHPNGIRSTSENVYSSTILKLEPLAAPATISASQCASQLGAQPKTTPPPSQPLLPFLGLKLAMLPVPRLASSSP